MATSNQPSIDRDRIGERGHWFVLLALTELVGEGEALFRPQFLGDKYPTIDLIVELDNHNRSFAPFFFVQVRATEQGRNASGHLQVRVDEEMMQRLIAYPAPTYIVGVDSIAGGDCYIAAAVPDGPTHYPSLPTAHKLHKNTLRSLFREILHFWDQNGAVFRGSQFL